MDYVLHESAKLSKKHSLAINGNIATVKRLIDPVFTLELNIENDFSFVSLTAQSGFDQRHINKAIAFARSSVLVKKNYKSDVEDLRVMLADIGFNPEIFSPSPNEEELIEKDGVYQKPKWHKYHMKIDNQPPVLINDRIVIV